MGDLPHRTSVLHDSAVGDGITSLQQTLRTMPNDTMRDKFEHKEDLKLILPEIKRKPPPTVRQSPIQQFLMNKTPYKVSIPRKSSVATTANEKAMVQIEK